MRGFPAEPETVHRLLSSHPSWVRVCGFAPKHAQEAYCYHPVPSLRKREQFDPIMREAGLWEALKWREVQHNLHAGVIHPEEE